MHAFTGKEEDIEVGLTYFGARYYAPYLGRFASADPLTIHGLGADLNPYAYVRGRVMTDIDPFGLCSADDSSDCQEVFIRHPHPNRSVDNVASRAEAGAENARNGFFQRLGAEVRAAITPSWVNAVAAGGGLRSGTLQWRNLGTGIDARTGFEQGVLDHQVLITALTGAQGRPGDSALYELGRATPGLVVLGLGFGSSGGSTPPSSAAEGGMAARDGSVGAMSASQRLLSWSPKSTPTWGHTFLTHGEGLSVTRGLIGRAGGTGVAQGQWLSNEAAANFLSSERPYIQGPTAIQLPTGVPAQVILPNGIILPAGHALLVPAPGGGFITAFPFLP